MANRISLKLTPSSKALIKRVSKLGKIDFRSSFKVIGISYRKEVKAIFEKQQPRETELSWAPLSVRYASWKERNFPGRPLMVLTGTLKDSMTKQGARGNITLIGKDRAVFGSSIIYANRHDEGTLGMPKRNFSLPSLRRIERWREQMERDISGQFERAGIQVKGNVFV